jgi:hypothetical protein
MDSLADPVNAAAANRRVASLDARAVPHWPFHPLFSIVEERGDRAVESLAITAPVMLDPSQSLQAAPVAREILATLRGDVALQVRFERASLAQNRALKAVRDEPREATPFDRTNESLPGLAVHVQSGDDPVASTRTGHDVQKRSGSFCLAAAVEQRRA